MPWRGEFIAQLLPKCGAKISWRYFLNLRFSRPQNSDRARGILSRWLEKGFDFPDVVGGDVHHRVADRYLISELTDKSHQATLSRAREQPKTPPLAMRSWSAMCFNRPFGLTIATQCDQILA
jgi:hypothetical protein